VHGDYPFKEFILYTVRMSWNPITKKKKTFNSISVSHCTT